MLDPGQQGSDVLQDEGPGLDARAEVILPGWLVVTAFAAAAVVQHAVPSSAVREIARWGYLLAVHGSTTTLLLLCRVFADPSRRVTRGQVVRWWSAPVVLLAALATDPLHHRFYGAASPCSRCAGPDDGPPATSAVRSPA